MSLSPRIRVLIDGLIGARFMRSHAIELLIIMRATLTTQWTQAKTMAFDALLRRSRIRLISASSWESSFSWGFKEIGESIYNVDRRPARDWKERWTLRNDFFFVVLFHMDLRFQVMLDQVMFRGYHPLASCLSFSRPGLTIILMRYSREIYGSNRLSGLR